MKLTCPDPAPPATPTTSNGSLTLVAIALGSLTTACGWTDADPAEIAFGPIEAGAAEGTLDLPIGTPMGGFSSRSNLLGGESRPDNRRGPYHVGFVPSAGAQTRPGVKALWLHNGADDLLILKADLIYSNDHYVADVTRALEAQTGRDLRGRVVISASHSHQSYGPFSDQFHFYLGGDRFNPEIYARLVERTVDIALDAYASLQPAKIGSGWERDWDPEDRVYRDRRRDNDDLHVWDDAEPGAGKDPYLHVLRVDDADDTPIALVFTFGIHGTAVGADSPMLSTEVTGHLENAVQNAFDHPIVAMHLQGAGGDASPAGRGARFARLEHVGDAGAPGILRLWEATPTSDTPLALEAVSRHVPQHHSQIRVTRGGTVDWRYAPLTDNPAPDDEIYDEDGRILSPIDEFNAPFGAVFCGSDAPLIPAGNIGSQVFPYSACMDAELVSRILYALFQLEEGEIPLPLPESLKAGTTATSLHPIRTLRPDGTVEEDDLYTGFFPGEPTAMYAEQFRRRARAELDRDLALTVGYAQDHEGYLLIPEDWLLGGYEPNINLWGPLQAEHIMEGLLDASAQHLGNGVRTPDAVGSAFSPTTYPSRPLPELRPDHTPTAGTRLAAPPEPTLWTPDAMPIDLNVPESLRRVQGMIQVAWDGGDAMVDLPVVSLLREVDGAWIPATTRSGRPVTDSLPDMLMTWTPDPLFPATADQTHRWWVVWQAVDHITDRAGLPLGRYRLRVQGQRYVGDEPTWPWTTEPYGFDTQPFEVTPAELTVVGAEDGVWVSLRGPTHGFRMIHPDGDADGDNPVEGPLTVWVDGEIVQPESVVQHGKRTFVRIDAPADAVYTVADRHGNEGSTGEAE
jgi:neutral ceramidase